MEKVVFLFPGQGSQYMSMGKNLYGDFEVVREVFAEANDVLGFDLRRICFEGTLSELNRMENMLPAILTYSVAAFRVYLKELGQPPSFMSGHSLGEYTALTCSGVLSFADTLRIIQKRSRLAVDTAEQLNGTMTIVENIDAHTLEKKCRMAENDKQTVGVSCYNSECNFAVSGHHDAVLKLEDLILEEGGRVTPLIGGVPFHSPLMAEAAEQLREELQKYSYQKAIWPVIANVNACPYTGPETTIDNLVRQMTHPVLWSETIEYLYAQGVTIAVEIGPRNILQNLLIKDGYNIKTCSFPHDDFQAMYELLGKPDHSLPTVVTRCLAMAAATRNRNFDQVEYQSGVIEPYQRLMEIQNELDRKGAYPNFSQMNEALALLDVIFRTKQVPIPEQKRRINRVFDETSLRHLYNEFVFH